MSLFGPRNISITVTDNGKQIKVKEDGKMLHEAVFLPSENRWACCDGWMNGETLHFIATREEVMSEIKRRWRDAKES